MLIDLKYISLILTIVGKICNFNMFIDFNLKPYIPKRFDLATTSL